LPRWRIAVLGQGRPRSSSIWPPERRKYSEVVEFVPSAGCRLKGAGHGCAFRIVRFLYATHADLDILPRLVLLPHGRVSGGASLRTGSIGEAWSSPFRFVFGSRFVFDDCRNVGVFRRLQQHRFLPSVRMAQKQFEAASQGADGSHELPCLVSIW